MIRPDDDAIVVVEPNKTTAMAVEKASDGMIAGLQIKIRGDELKRRMEQRIRAREESIAAIERRIEKRAGEPGNEYKTVADLEDDRQVQRDVLLRIELVRNGLVDDELYVLSLSDLRVADLISSIPDANGWNGLLEPSDDLVDAASRR